MKYLSEKNMLFHVKFSQKNPEKMLQLFFKRSILGI